jgi:hypothetical protein
VIVFDLKCEGGHVFEAWFGSSGDFEDQQRRGLVECPICGDKQVAKAVMAPRIPAKGGGPSPAEMKQMLAKLAGAQKRILDKSDYVGERFADEARAIHLGEADARSIYGKATPAETESLKSEGIAVAPLPFPVTPPGEKN